MNLDSDNLDDEINLYEIWQAIWLGKKTIFAVTICFCIASIIYSILQPNIYKSEALLMPVPESQGGGLSALAGQFGGIASLAGVDLNSGGPDQTVIALETLKSRTFIKEFIDEHELMPLLIASKGWDRKNQKLIIDDGIYNTSSKKWIKSRSSRAGVPTDNQAYVAFRKILHISQDKKSSLITIGISFYSPSIARQWVDWLVEDLNDYMRKQDYDEATEIIDYLNEQLTRTSIAGMQAIFYQLIEEQTKTIMLSRIRQDYILKTIDRAVIPEQKSRPKRAFVIVGITLSAGLISTILVLMRSFSRKSSSSSDSMH